MKDPRNMTFNELKRWLSDRLQMRGNAAADISIRRDEAPYEQPAKLWQSGSDTFRINFKRAVMDLIAEAGAAPWEPAHFNELGLLIEAANLWEAVTPLEDIAQSKRLLEHDHGPQLHMLALRTLLALRWTGTLDFWLAQKEAVGTRWPGIIFEGLARQDVDLAFGQLSELVTSRETMREVLHLFPGLMRDLRLGISTLRERCRSVVDKLPPDAAVAMRDWFRLRNYPIELPARQVNLSLTVAIRSVLVHDSEPRFRTPMLCGRSEGNCVPA
jgi:hypothetical protein